METIDRILSLREYTAGAIMQSASVFDMIRLMADKGVGALLVLEPGKLVGIAMEGDHVRIVNLARRPFNEAQVREIIARKVIYTPLEQVVEKCLALTQEKQIRHLPVVADGCLIGIISMGDLAKTILSDQEDEVQISSHM
jgi:predicted transcriptional regulator